MLYAAGLTDRGRQRTVNEDRFHADASRGLFIVIDGVGGQAAGGKAADVAMNMLRTRLERETGPVGSRIREALSIANNEIHRLAGTRPEWSGMACVATVVIVSGSRAFVGHVGDTRLYRLTASGVDKITRDHSPIGEREDAGELTEFEAMHHPRRNEVYRDLGSDSHDADDADFADVFEVDFTDDCALLLCSDGLTDLVDIATIEQLIRNTPADARHVVAELVRAANEAGGKDNVTVVYVAGRRFGAASAPMRAANVPEQPAPALPASSTGRGEQYVRLMILVLLVALIAFTIDGLPPRAPSSANAVVATQNPSQLVVRRGESIAEALGRASAGTEVVVEPGEYREAVSLPSNVRLISRVPRGAVIRLPATAGETDAAFVARGVSGAALVGFRIVGDATTALGTGLLVQDSELVVTDSEISGATQAAIDVTGASRVEVMASSVHDNPGVALSVRSGAAVRVVHNVFARNAGSPATPAPIILDETGDLTFNANMFHDVHSSAFRALSEPDRSAISRDNWFAPVPSGRAAPARPRGARGGDNRAPTRQGQP